MRGVRRRHKLCQWKGGLCVGEHGGDEEFGVAVGGGGACY